MRFIRTVAPDRHGGRAPERLYIGVSTTCVRRRLLQHLSDEENPELRKQLRMFPDLVQFSVVFTEGATGDVGLGNDGNSRDWQPETNRYKLRSTRRLGSVDILQIETISVPRAFGAGTRPVPTLASSVRGKTCGCPAAGGANRPTRANPHRWLLINPLTSFPIH